MTLSLYIYIYTHTYIYIYIYFLTSTCLRGAFDADPWISCWVPSLGQKATQASIFLGNVAGELFCQWDTTNMNRRRAPIITTMI